MEEEEEEKEDYDNLREFIRRDDGKPSIMTCGGVLSQGYAGDTKGMVM